MTSKNYLYAYIENAFLIGKGIELIIHTFFRRGWVLVSVRETDFGM